MFDLVHKRIRSFDWESKIGFDCYGTKVGIQLDDRRLVPTLQKLFPPKSTEIDFEEADEIFSLITNESSELNGFYRELDGEIELVHKFENIEETTFVGIENKLLFVVAMVSPPRMFYFHAGAVSINGAGIIIPGNTRAGKTTLVREFIERGAVYYSDDCALVDAEGNLNPFPVPLAVREGEDRIYFSPEDFGAKEGKEPVKVRYILLTKYVENSLWRPTRMRSGEAGFTLLEHFFFRASVRRKPAETLDFVSRLASQAVVLESPRNEASEVVEWFLRELEVDSTADSKRPSEV